MASVPSLHRESTDSLIAVFNMCLTVCTSLFQSSRNPDVSHRPQPKDVLRALLVEEVMAIPPEDVPAGSQADVLGAPLPTAAYLYPTLQSMYRTQTH